MAVGPNHDLNYIYLHTEYYRSFKNYYIHPKYIEKIKVYNGENISETEHDIGLIELNRPFKLGEDTGRALLKFRNIILNWFEILILGIYAACLLDHQVDDFGNGLILAGYGYVEPVAKVNDGRRKIVSTTKLLMTRMRHMLNSYIFCQFSNLICTQNLESATCFGSYNKRSFELIFLLNIYCILNFHQAIVVDR